MATVDIPNDAALVTFAATYDPGDVGELSASSYTLSAVLSLARGDFTLRNTSGGNQTINMGRYGITVSTTTVITIDFDPDDNGYKTIIDRDSALADNHCFFVSAGTGIITGTIKRAFASGHTSVLSEVRSGFRCEASTGICDLEFIECDASDCSNDGFAGSVTNTAGECNILMTDCTGSGNLDQAFSPHEHTFMRVYGGVFESTSATGNVAALGTGTSSDQPGRLFISGAELTGTGCAVLLQMSQYNSVTITGASQLQINTSGHMFGWKSNDTLIISGDTDLDVNAGCFMWDNVDSLTGSSLLCVNSTIHVPDIATGSANNVFMDRAVPTVDIVGCEWDMVGSTIASLITYVNTGHTWRIEDCTMNGGDFPGASHYNGPAFNAVLGTLKFLGNHCDLSEWETHTAAHYKGYVGSENVAGTIIANGNTMYGLPDLVTGDKRRTVISLINGSSSCEVKHNTLFNDNTEATSLSYGIYIVPTGVDPHANFVLGRWNTGIRKDSSYAGTFNVCIGDFSGGLGPFYLGAGSMDATDVNSGDAVAFQGGSSPTTIAGFALSAAESRFKDSTVAGKQTFPRIKLAVDQSATQIEDNEFDATIAVTPDVVPHADNDYTTAEFAATNHRGAVADRTATISVAISGVTSGKEYWGIDDDADGTPEYTDNPHVFTLDAAGDYGVLIITPATGGGGPASPPPCVARGGCR